MKIYLNGQIVEQAEARVSVLDRSYLYGEGLFETFRSYEGTLPFLDQHLARLEWSATYLGLPFPHPREIKKAIEQLLQENKLADARIKIVLSGINESIKPQLVTDNTPVNLVILMDKFVPLPEADYQKGGNLAVIHSTRNEPCPGANIKSTSYACKMIARREFMERDCLDGILLNAVGLVAETTAANVFWVKNEMLYTPPVDAGCLPGITRAILLGLCKEHKIPFQESTVNEEELKKVSEVFITGSTLEVMPVTRIDDQIIGSGKPGVLTQKIRSLYKHRIKKEIEATPAS